MDKKTYSERQITAFLELAKELGIARAIRQLQYPTFPTAKKWAEQRGVKLPLNQLAIFATNMQQLYAHEEKLYAAQLLLDRIVERTNAGEELEGSELKLLAEAYKRVVESMNLVEGKATNINGQANGFDSDIQAMIEEQERINKARQLGDKA